MPKRDVYSETLPPKQRIAAATLVVAAHLALLISFKTQMPPLVAPQTAGQNGASLEIVEMAAPSKPFSSPVGAAAAVAPAVRPPPPKPERSTPELIEHPETLGLPAPSTDLEPVSVGDPVATLPRAARAGIASDDPCHFDQLLQIALQDDEAVRRALTLIPRASRSVANAIMVWNGQWVPIEAMGGEASLAPIRAAIVKSLSVTSAGCLTRTNNGPLFITIPGWPETTVLAVGSGEWRATDLIADATELDSAPAPPPSIGIWRQFWPD